MRLGAANPNLAGAVPSLMRGWSGLFLRVFLALGSLAGVGCGTGSGPPTEAPAPLGETWQAAAARLLHGSAGTLEVSLPRRGGTTASLEVGPFHDPPRRAPLTLRFEPRVEDGAWRLDVRAMGSAWRAVVGCEGEDHWSWPWEGEEPPVEASDVLYRAAQAVGGDPTKMAVVVAAETVPAERVLRLLQTLADGGVVAVLRDGVGRGRPFAVEPALAYLAEHQRADGAWDAASGDAPCASTLVPGGIPSPGEGRALTATTSVALLAFLGAGYTNRGRHPFASVVAKGLRFLKGRQAPDGTFDPRGTARRLRGHALATWTWSEVYGRTESPLWKGPARSALTALEALWHDEPGERDDACLVALALASARSIEQDYVARGRTPAWRVAEDVVDEVERALERPSGSEDSRDRVAALAGLLALDDDTTDPRALRIVAKTRWPDLQRENPDPFQAMLWTLCASRAGHAIETAWYDQLSSSLRPRQRGGEPCCTGGSWDPDPAWRLDGGRVEATAWLAMTLQLRYGYGACRVGHP